MFPYEQTVYHHIPDVSPVSPRGAIAWLGFFGLVFGVRRWVRARPLAAWALLCCALFLIPSSSIVALKESMAEHRAYATGFYLLLALAWSLPASWYRRSLISTGILIPVLVALTGDEAEMTQRHDSPPHSSPAVALAESSDRPAAAPRAALNPGRPAARASGASARKGAGAGEQGAEVEPGEPRQRAVVGSAEARRRPRLLGGGGGGRAGRSVSVGRARGATEVRFAPR